MGVSDPSKGRAERGLMRAVLKQALAEYLDVSADRRKERLSREAGMWITSSEENFPFSFINICRNLGIDPDYLRQGAKRLRRTRLDAAASAAEQTLSASCRALRHLSWQEKLRPLRIGGGTVYSRKK